MAFPRGSPDDLSHRPVLAHVEDPVVPASGRLVAQVKRSHLIAFALWFITALAILIFTSCTSLQTRADDSITKALDQVGEKSATQIDRAASRGSELIDRAASRGSEVVTKAVTELEGAASRVLDRVERDTLPKVRAQTTGLLDDIAKWWDKIGLGLLTLVSGIYAIVKGKSAKLHKKALGTVVKAGERMNGGADELKRHVEADLKDKVAPKIEYAIRALIRAAKKETR